MKMASMILVAVVGLLSVGGASFSPLIGQRRHPTYTTETIREMYAQYSTILSRTESKAVDALIDMLVQVALQYQSRLDLLEQSQAGMRADISELSVELSYIKKFVYEQISIYHQDSNIVRQNPSKSMFMPTWDVNQDVQPDSGLRTVSSDMRSINNSLTALSLRVDTLDYHLEEVEAIVYAVKEATVDEFSEIINQVIPELHNSIEDRYKKVMEDHVEYILDGYMNSTSLTSTKSREENEPCEVEVISSIQDLGTNGDTRISSTDDEHTFTQMEVQTTTTVQSPTVTTVLVPTTQATQQVVVEIEKEEESNFTSRGDLIEYYGSQCDRADILAVTSQYSVLEVNGKRNRVIGSWTQDSYSKSSSVYMVQGYRKIALLMEFANMVELSKGVISRVYDLPFKCGGTGHAVYNNSFYCHGFKSNKLYRLDLNSREWNESRLIGEDVHGRYSYSINGFNNADLMADGGGLWVVYASKQSEGNMTVAKLNTESFTIEYMENTHTNMTLVSNSFMICGELFAIFHTQDRKKVLRKVWSLYDTDSDFSDYQNLTLDSDTSVLMMAEFNAKDHKLYTWNLHRMGEGTLRWYELKLTG